MSTIIPNPLRSGVRWGVKAAGGLAANLALLTVWVDDLGWPPELAVFINWALLSIAGYLVTDNWVYADGQTPSTLTGHVKRYAGLQSVMAGSKALNYAIYVALIWLSVDYRLAWAIGAVVTFLVSFGGSRSLWHRPPILERG